MDDFSRGMSFVFQGVGEFFRHVRLWRFVALPFLAVLALYALLYFAALEIWLPTVLNSVRDFFAGSWFAFLYRATEILIKVTFYVFLTALTAFFAGNLFELFGCVGFAQMVRCYETEILNCPVAALPPTRKIRNFIDGTLFSCGTLLWYLFFFCVSLFLPMVALPAMIFFIGRRYAVVYTSEAVYDAGHRLGEIPALYHGRGGLLYGFGAMSFLIFLVPLLPVFLIPGMVIGGTLMYHRRDG